MCHIQYNNRLQSHLLQVRYSVTYKCEWSHIQSCFLPQSNVTPQANRHCSLLKTYPFPREKGRHAEGQNYPNVPHYSFNKMCRYGKTYKIFLLLSLSSSVCDYPPLPLRPRVSLLQNGIPPDTCCVLLFLHALFRTKKKNVVRVKLLRRTLDLDVSHS